MKRDFTKVISELSEQGVSVLLGTQCRYEGSSLHVYETGKRGLSSGVMEAFDMTSEAAITKLMWVLGQTENPDEVREYFRVNLCGEVTIPE